MQLIRYIRNIGHTISVTVNVIWFYHRSLVICPWGEKGASARLKEGKIVSSQAFPPEHVVDTLGAGDTFIAATIFALAQGHKPEDSILFGCRVAGTKVGVRGWEPLRHLFKSCDFLPAMVDSGSRRDVVMNTTWYWEFLPDSSMGANVEGVVCAAWVYLLVLLVIWQLFFSDYDDDEEWLWWQQYLDSYLFPHYSNVCALYDSAEYSVSQHLLGEGVLPG